MVNKGGRPKNTATVCAVCGKVLINENTRETRKGSGRLRAKCNECASKTKTAKVAAAERRAAKEAIASQQELRFSNGVIVRILVRRLNWLVPKKGVKYADRGAVATAPVTKAGTVAKTVVRVGTKSNGKPRYREVIAHCAECDGEMVYHWKTQEKYCSQCGLMDEEANFDAANGQFTTPARYKTHLAYSRNVGFYDKDAGAYDAVFSQAHLRETDASVNANSTRISDMDYTPESYDETSEA
jgi:hypothetical protein